MDTMIEIVAGGIDVIMQAMVDFTGSFNIVGEMWTSSLGDGLSLKALDNGSLVLAGDGVITGAGEGFFISKDLAEKHGLNTIEDVLAKIRLIYHTEDSSKGAIVTCFKVGLANKKF